MKHFINISLHKTQLQIHLANRTKYADQIHLANRTKYADQNDELIIELGLFVDDALWLHFQQLCDNKADLTLRNYEITHLQL
uniref:Uncharacterized protein n=1 Tax=Wuchereria bancrofti TaxID=6293 RepID=A0AAF5RY12_WUCBA